MIRTEDCTQIFYKDWGPKDAQPIVFHRGWANGYRVAATENLAVEYANDGIRFNAAAPGVVDSQMPGMNATTRVRSAS